MPIFMWTKWVSICVYECLKPDLTNNDPVYEFPLLNIFSTVSMQFHWSQRTVVGRLCSMGPKVLNVSDMEVPL